MNALNLKISSLCTDCIPFYTTLVPFMISRYVNPLIFCSHHLPNESHATTTLKSPTNLIPNYANSPKAVTAMFALAFTCFLLICSTLPKELYAKLGQNAQEQRQMLFSVSTHRQKPKQNGRNQTRKKASKTTKTSTKPKPKLGFRIPTQLKS